MVKCYSFYPTVQQHLTKLMALFLKYCFTCPAETFMVLLLRLHTPGKLQCSRPSSMDYSICFLHRRSHLIPWLQIYLHVTTFKSVPSFVTLSVEVLFLSTMPKYILTLTSIAVTISGLNCWHPIQTTFFQWH